MSFLFLGIFSRFFWVKILILMLKLNNKKCKKGLLIRAGPTWHARPRGRAMRAHAAMWRMRDIYI